ncbi:MAG: carbohydrate kinase [Anaerolineae bacterium]|nr:carbohydrate kinase [Anaerolineae bacterium]
MNKTRLKTLLNRFSETHILVLGDFFLDLYLDLDRALSETSLETGLEAYQVAGVRSSPGAAGTVTSNLRALGVGVTALGVIGDDGMGYELLRGLRQWGVDTKPLLQTADRLTPTYTKPMMKEADGRIHELNRLDIKNRGLLSTELEERVISQSADWIGQVDGIIVADQVQERNCGVVTDRVRAALAELALAHPGKVIAADSRARIGEFRNLIIKPNEREAVHAIRPDWVGEMDRAAVEACGRELDQRNGRPVFLTIGAEGILVFDDQGMSHVPGIRVSGPIDIVGAGDSAMAGIVSALCAGASPAEAALVGNLVASITIQQIGVTGTATPQQVLARHQERDRGLFL